MKKIYKYIVIAAILIIPFIYSFFYLKAYWNPYGEGNIDNLPVAVINADKGDKGKKLINSIKDKKKLKLNIVSSKEATEGLYNGEYYAILTISESFTSDMESASTTNKTHATITYSPNQKSNYLASQIINNVVINAEKSLDNEINSQIVSKLSNTTKEVPNKLETISNGFRELSDGTNKLSEGSNKIQNGVNTLNSNYIKFNEGVHNLEKGSNDLNNNYNKFNNGIKDLKDGVSSLQNNYSQFDNGLKNLNEGINVLDESTNSLTVLNSSLTELINGVSTINSGSNQLTSNLNSYIEGVNNTLTYSETLAIYVKDTICPKVVAATANQEEQQLCGIANTLLSEKTEYLNNNTYNYLKYSGNEIKTGNSKINTGINELNTKVQGLNSVSERLNNLKVGITKIRDGSNNLTSNSSIILSGINNLENGVNTISNSSEQVLSGTNTLRIGANTLATSSEQVLSGINTLNGGTNTLSDGINTLDRSVKSAKIELDTNITKTKNDIKSLDGLDKYSKEPIKVKTKEVNKVSSYGTAFAPLFISVGLWVGCLMMFIVLYYDKEQRFGIFGIENNKRVLRNLSYHGLATLSGLVLSILLYLFLDFNITNMGLYILIVIIIANMFMSIIQFLITNLDDLGKFIALILLVLQLASSGGTFPIEVVTKGFRWLNPFLPMTYTIRLIKEPLMNIDNNLLNNNIIIVIIILIVFFIINLFLDIIKQRKNN